jgi:hypothetical protein
MKSFKIVNKSGIVQNEIFEGEPIELKVARIVLNNEPIKDGAPLIYTDGHDINADTDVRTDTFEVAVLAMDKANKARYHQKRNIDDSKKDEKNITDDSSTNNATIQ